MIMDNLFYFGLSWESRFENSISKQQIEKEEADERISFFSTETENQEAIEWPEFWNVLVKIVVAAKKCDDIV